VFQFSRAQNGPAPADGPPTEIDGGIASSIHRPRY